MAVRGAGSFAAARTRLLTSVGALAAVMVGLEVAFLPGVLLSAVLQPGLSSGQTPFLRSLSLGLATVLLVVPAGWIGGLALRRTSARLEPLLFLALVPILVGSAAVAVLFKPLFQAFDVLETRPPLETWAFVLLLQLWHYGPATAMFVALQIRRGSPSREDYFAVHALTLGEKVRHHYWPECRWTIALLGVFAFFAGYSEAAKLDVLLHPSNGTSTLTFGHWLSTEYMKWQATSAELARRYVLVASGNVVIPVLTVCFGVAGALTWLLGKLSPLVAADLPRRFVTLVKDLPAIGMTGLVLAPIAIGWPSSWDWPALSLAIEAVSSALLYAGPAALILVALTIIASAALRYLPDPGLASFGPTTLAVLLGLMVVRAVPANGISLATYEWIAITGLEHPYAVVTLWALGQFVFHGPLLLAFAILLGFSVSQSEVTYFKLHRVPFWRVVRLSFLTRFTPGYVLIWFFGLAFCLGDTAITSPLSGAVASVGHGMKVLAGSGRASDGNAAAILALTAMLVATLLSVATGILQAKSLQAE